MVREESRITIPFAHLKAVFFVHDFAGTRTIFPERTPTMCQRAAGGSRSPSSMASSSRRDARLQPECAGFFVSPLDSTSNNIRIFVLAGAIRHVQFHDGPARASALPATSVAR
jgi:hypothetical protein